MTVMLSSQLASSSHAQEPADTDGASDDGSDYTSTTTAHAPDDDGRATSRVERDELQLRLPRSAPDALRYEPGVFVQQTAHAQGSPYIRGRTGQQTVLLFDNVRLNNSTFRQGPNQYFFTIDSQTIERIDVARGSASTRYGSDAIAGVLHAHPIEPELGGAGGGLQLHPRGFFDYGSADDRIGGRLQLSGALGDRLGWIGGLGYRTVGELEAGGAVLNPADGELPEVPRFDDDGRTQLGTGFDELTADGRLVTPVGEAGRLVLAYYGYYQSDAPRTDQCAPPFAPFDECLRYDEQYRTLVYAGYDGRLGKAARRLQLTLSWQRQHELRTHERPGSFTVNGGRDDVDTFGFRLAARTARLPLSKSVQWQLRYGADAYIDVIDTLAWLELTDVDIIRLRSRGQYLDGSTYSYGGLFAENELRFFEDVDLQLGGRVALARADAPADPESGTLAVDDTWAAAVGNVGVEWRALPGFSILLSADQGFRAPNLDDLTSRQQTGPGFQIENAALQPERSLTLETGLRYDHTIVSADVWAYRMTLRDGIERVRRTIQDCPQNTPACNSSWAQLQLVNLEDTATIVGAEGALRFWFPYGLDLQLTISWAHGRVANPEERPSDPAADYDQEVPLSRIPPLNGTAELLWTSAFGLYSGAGLRWAAAQDRLAPSDRSDARIPIGGTPGFAVLDLRAGYRFERKLLVALVLENLLDTAYRYHASSLNGPGRGVLIHVEGGF